MRPTKALALVLCLTGCADFSGDWVGHLLPFDGTCSDGSALRLPVQTAAMQPELEWVIATKGSSLSIVSLKEIPPTLFSCSPVTAKQEGATATFDGRCASFTDPNTGAISTTTFSGSAFIGNGGADAMDVFFDNTVDVRSSSQTGRCDFKSVGSLLRRNR